MTRIAHISDLHLNGTPDRFARTLGAIRAARDVWHATHLVVTGDLTKSGRPEHYAQLGAVLQEWPHTATVVPGNHDGGTPRFLGALQTSLARFRHSSTPGAVTDLGDALVVAVDTQYARRALGFKALGHVSPQALGQLAGLAGVASPQKHIVVAMHHGPHGQHGLLRMFADLTNRHHVNRTLGATPYMSVCCGHDHRAQDLGQVHVAASVATHPDALRVYDVRGGRLVPVYQSAHTGDGRPADLTLAGVPTR